MIRDPSNHGAPQGISLSRRTERRLIIFYYLGFIGILGFVLWATLYMQR